jgi:hypothetical protein
MIERRQERRTQIDLTVQITGRDVRGNPFAQSAVASSISGGGALLSGLAREVRAGDLVSIEYQDRKGRFRVVWAKRSQSEQKIQAAVHRLENERCPWVALLEKSHQQ